MAPSLVAAMTVSAWTVGTVLEWLPGTRSVLSRPVPARLLRRPQGKAVRRDGRVRTGASVGEGPAGAAGFGAGRFGASRFRAAIGRRTAGAAMPVAMGWFHAAGV